MGSPDQLRQPATPKARLPRLYRAYSLHFDYVVLSFLAFILASNLILRIGIGMSHHVTMPLQSQLQQLLPQMRLEIAGISGAGLMANPRLQAWGLKLSPDIPDPTKLADIFDYSPEEMAAVEEQASSVRGKAIKIGAIDARIKLLPSLLTLSPRFTHISIHNCELPFEQIAGSWRLGGLRLDRGGGGGTSAQQLAVEDIFIRNCRITWQSLEQQQKQQLRIDVAHAHFDGFQWKLLLKAHHNDEALHIYGNLTIDRSGNISDANLYLEAGQSLALTLAGTVMSQRFLPSEVRALQNRIWVRRNNYRPYQVSLRSHADLVRTEIPRLTMESPTAELRLEWRDSDDFTMVLSRLDFTQQGDPVEFAAAVIRKLGTTKIFIDQVAAEYFVQVALGAQFLSEDVADVVRGMAPTGKLDNVMIILPHYTVSTEWSIAGEVQDLALQSSGYLPGLNRINGHVTAYPDYGSFEASGNDVTVSIEALFSPRLFTAAAATVIWKLPGDGVELSVENARLKPAEGGSIEGNLTLLFPPVGSNKPPFMELNGKGLDFDLPTGLSFIPDPYREDLPAWLFTNSHGGIIDQAELRLRGEIWDEVPEDQWPLGFRLWVKFQDGRLITPTGLELNDLSGNMEFVNADAKGTIHYTSTLGTVPWDSGKALLLMDKDQWTLDIYGDHLRGLITSVFDQPELSADIARIDIPHFADMEFATSTGTSSLDPVVVKIDTMSMTEQALGNAAFHVFAEGYTLTIAQLQWEAPQLGLAVRDTTVTWSGTGPSEQIAVQGQVLFCDIPNVIRSRGCSTKNFRHNGQVQVDIAWPGGPTDFSTTTTRGIVQAELRNGRFIKVDRPDVLRVFELFNMDTMVRRLGLNVSSASSEGLEYFVVQGMAEMDDGIVTLGDEGMFMSGVSGRFRMTGEVDMLDRSVAAKLQAILPIRENLGWVGVAAGAAAPIVAGVWGLNKLFSKQLDNVFSKWFSITGSWDDIQIEPIE